MSNLPRRLTDALNDVGGRESGIGRYRVPARVEQAVAYAVAVEHGRGIVRAAQIRAQEYVTSEALQAIARLADLESLYVRHSPLGENRCKAIADTSALVMTNIVAEGGRH